MKSNWLLLCLLLLSIKGGSSSFSHNVQDPFVKNYELSARLYSGDATVPLYIATPAQISTVVGIDIEKGKEYCEVSKMTAKAEKLKSYRIDYDMNLDNLQWNVQIMSIAQDYTRSIIYVLLQNGTLLAVSFSSQKNPVVVNNYSYQSIGASNTWLTRDHELIFTKSQLYVLVNEEVKAVSIHAEGYWSIASMPLITGVISWYAGPIKLFVLTNQRIHTINGQTVEQFGPKGSKFIDFSIYGPNYFILDEKEGILSGVIGRNTTKLIQIQYPSKSIGIEAGEKVLMVTYENEGRNYLAEYFLNSDGSTVLNRYYHSYYEIKDLQLRGQYAVIDTYNGVIVMRHSVNRKSFSSLSPVEFLYQLQGARTVTTKWLASSSQLHLLLVLKDQIQYLSLESLDSSTSTQLNALYVKCSSQSPITTDIKITYKGICSDSSFPSSAYSCLARSKDTISFVFAHQRKQAQAQTNRYVFLFACVLLALFTILILLGLRKRVSEALNKLKTAESAISNRKQQHSQNMEQTFNADIVH